MLLKRLLLLAAVLGIAACSNPSGLSDCVYDKTAISGPGYQFCGPVSDAGQWDPGTLVP